MAGGPIHGPVLAIHRQEEFAEVELQHGVFVSSQKEAIDRLSEMAIDQSESPFRIVMGAMNWRHESLVSEIENGIWFVLDPDPDQIFSAPAMMWENALRRHGAKLIQEVTGIRIFPADPLLN